MAGLVLAPLLIPVQSAFAVTVTAGSIAAVEGAPFNGQVATFSDVAVLGCQASSSYKSTVTWSDDATTSPAVIGTPTTSSLTTCVYPVTAAHRFTQIGGLHFTVGVSGSLGSGSATGNANITPAPLTAQSIAISAVEGQSFTAAVATFSDGFTGRPASHYAASIDWGDGSSMPATVVPNATGDFEVDAGHAYASAGSYTMTVRVSEPEGPHTATTATAAVADAPLGSTGVAGTAVEQQGFGRTVATFTDADAGRPAGHYSATVNWGDGTATPTAAIATDPTAGFDVTAGHTYANPGSYTTTTTITDADGARTTATAQTTVSDASLGSTGVSNSAIEQAGFTHTVARFSDADPGRPAGHYSASINWGDGSPTAAAGIATDPTGGFDVTAGHTYANPGSYTTTTTIADADGARTTASAQVTVADAPLTSTAIAINAIAGQSFPANLAIFTDADSGRPASHYSASVNWGDGATTVSAAITADSAGGYEVSSTHTYAKPGSYTISVTITDVGGSRTVASSTATVAAPPPPPPPADTSGTTTRAPSSAKPTSTPATTLAKPAILPTPKVSLTVPRLSPSRTNISIDVTCPAGGASCQGVVRLTTLPSSGSKVAALRRGATLGSVLFVLHPNQSKTFTIHIATKTLRLLRQAGVARVQGVAIAFGQTGNSTSSGAVAKIATAAPKSKSH